MTKDTHKALDNYNKSIDLDTNNSYAYNSKGALYYDFLDNDSLALVNYYKAVMLDKTNIRVLYNLGACLRYLEYYEEEIIFLTKAIELKKAHHKAYYERGLSYYYLDMYKNAIGDLKRAKKYNNFNDPYEKLDNREIYKYLALCYEKNGNKKKATYYQTQSLLQN